MDNTAVWLWGSYILCEALHKAVLITKSDLEGALVDRHACCLVGCSLAQCIAVPVG